MGYKHKKLPNKKNTIKVKHIEDRLSSLPDDILIKILSLLPLSYAITFATLSSRWTSLWTHVKGLDIERCYPERGDPRLCYWTSLNEAFPKLVTSHFTTRFTLNLHYRLFEDDDCWSLLDDWFRQLNDRGVEDIKVICNNANCMDYYPFVAPPTSIFSMHSLVLLELGSSSGLCWNLPNGDDISLPKLKKLSIHTVLELNHHALLGQLISSCPSLEDLSFTMIKGEDRFYYPNIEFSAQNLRRLHICLGKVRVLRKVVVDAPRLAYLFYNAHHSTIVFANKPILLLEADIRFSECSMDEMMLQFLDSISHVRTLLLDVGVLSAQTMFPSANYSTLSSSYYPPLVVRPQTFPRVTQLTLTMSFRCEFRTLVMLLNLCSTIEVVILRFDHFCEENLKQFISAAKLAPDQCVSSDVKRVEIKTYRLWLDEHLLDLIKHLLRCAPNMEKLSLSCTKQLGHFGRNKLNKQCFGGKLSTHLRRLSQCQVEFAGEYRCLEKYCRYSI